MDETRELPAKILLSKGTTSAEDSPAAKQYNASSLGLFQSFINMPTAGSIALGASFFIPHVFESPASFL
jgi:hypothetical protein